MSSIKPKEAFIRKAREGRRAAFEELVKEHQSPFKGMIQARLGDALRSRVEVADVLQETKWREQECCGRRRGGCERESQAESLYLERRRPCAEQQR